MVAVMEKAESTTSKEFEIDQSIEVLVGSALEKVGDAPSEAAILQQIQQLMMDRVQLLTPTIHTFAHRKAG